MCGACARAQTRSLTHGTAYGTQASMSLFSSIYLRILLWKFCRVHVRTTTTTKKKPPPTVKCWTGRWSLLSGPHLPETGLTELTFCQDAEPDRSGQVRCPRVQSERRACRAEYKSELLGKLATGLFQGTPPTGPLLGRWG